MKKITKVMLSLGIGLCVLGGVLCSVGIASNGADYVRSADLNRMNAKVESKENYEILQKTEIETFEQLDVRLFYMDLQILPSGDDKFYMEYQYNTGEGRNSLDYSTSGGVLTIKQHSKGNWSTSMDLSFLSWIFGNHDMYQNEIITLYVPEKAVLETCKVQAEDSEVYVEGFHSKKAEFALPYGRLTLESVWLGENTVNAEDTEISAEKAEGGKWVINNSYGSVTLDDVSLEQGKVKMEDGSIVTAELGIEKKMDIQNVYGNTTLGIEEICLENLSMHLKTNYGEIKVREKLEGGMTSHDDDEQSDYSRIGNPGGGTLTVNHTDGDIIIP